jgi:hypothetical protein
MKNAGDQPPTDRHYDGTYTCGLLFVILYNMPWLGSTEFESEKFQ